MRYFTLFLMVIICGCTSAQPSTAELLKDAKTKLEKDSATVSAILSDKKYIPVHPETTFRELIEKHSGTGLLEITEPGEPGRKIIVIVTVKDKAGNLLAGVPVYLYQTDSHGWYSAASPHVGGNEGDMRHARLFGYVKTDAKGQFELHTVKPSGYPQSDLPAHIHIHFSADGYQPYVTELLFDDDERLIGNIRQQAMQNQFIIARPEKAVAPFVQQFSYSIVLEKKH
ncbi:MAG: hypothetical protein ABIT05_10095 [Chitinophagaceae bacterium]